MSCVSHISNVRDASLEGQCTHRGEVFSCEQKATARHCCEPQVHQHLPADKRPLFTSTFHNPTRPYLTLPHYFDHIIKHIHVAACHVYNTHINNGQVVARMDKFTRTAEEVTITRLQANNSGESNTPTTVA
jgi:hypothetical protein